MTLLTSTSATRDHFRENLSQSKCRYMRSVSVNTKWHSIRKVKPDVVNDFGQ